MKYIEYFFTAFYWVDTVARGGVPSTALEGGYDSDGERIYVGRAFYEGDWLPAKVIPGKNAAYISWGGQEVFVDRFEVSYKYFLIVFKCFEIISQKKFCEKSNFLHFH